MRPDYYQLLDVAESADAREIKAAFRRQAKRLHPDVNAADPSAEERFKAVLEAYRVLGEAKSRAEYDAWLLLHKRVGAAAELASMPRRSSRMSVRHAYERKAQRQQRRAWAGAYARGRNTRRMRMLPTLVISRWYIVVVYALALSLFLPWAIRYATYDPAKEAAEYAERQRARVADVAARAATGEADACYRYAFMLYKGSDGVQKDAEAAICYWRMAAVKGHRGALRALHHLGVPVSDVPRGAPF